MWLYYGSSHEPTDGDWEKEMMESQDGGAENKGRKKKTDTLSMLSLTHSVSD